METSGRSADRGDGLEATGQPITRRGLLKLSVAGGALIIGPGLLAACGSDDEGGSGSSGGQTSGGSGSSGSASGTSGGSGASGSASGSGGTSSGGQGSGGGSGGGEVTVGVVGDILNFDPYNFETSNSIILRNMNAFLINYDDKLTPEAACLEKWEINDDHTQATLTLKPDIKLQTGKTWDADDLVQSFKRAQDPNEGNQLHGPMSIVKDYKKTDDHTVVVTFASPVATLLVTDLLQSFPAMDASGNSSAKLKETPASGGPFKLDSRKAGNQIVTSKFDDYWNADEVSLAGVTYKIFSDADSLVAALQSGAVDVIYNFPPKNAKQIQDSFTIVKGYPGALVDCLRMNPNTPPFDNVKLRQAVMHALDRERIVKEVYYGFSQPLFLPWGPNSPANDPSYKDKNKFDLDLAKKLWQEGGAPTSATILANGSETTQLHMVQILQQTLQQIGFNLKIKSTDPATYADQVVHGKFGIVFNALGNTSKSPSRITTNSIFRIEGNVVLDKKLPQAYVDAIHASEGAINDQEAQKAYDALNKVISEQAFGVAVCVKPTLTGTKKSVTGVSRTVDNQLVLKDAKVAS